MHRIKVSLPATATQFGPAQAGLGLALGLRATVEFTETTGDRLLVETGGEDAGRYSLGLRHPVVLGLTRVFQQQERAVLGLTVRIHNEIPPGDALGTEAAFIAAGIIGANNLLGSPLRRSEVLALAVRVSGQPEHAVTTILGGLNACLCAQDGLIYRNLPAAPLLAVVALPAIDLPEVLPPERIARPVALDAVRRMPLLVEGLRAGDVPLLAQALEDRLFAPHVEPLITGLPAVKTALAALGPAAVTLLGGGPALLIFSTAHVKSVQAAIVQAFAEHKVNVRTWAAPIDTQGVLVSAAQMP
jgi:homoserine kinase